MKTSCFFFSCLFQGAISALQNQPVVNAVIDGEDIIYRDYVDISIAVGTPKVPFFHLLYNFLLNLKFKTYTIKLSQRVHISVGTSCSSASKRRADELC